MPGQALQVSNRDPGLGFRVGLIWVFGLGFRIGAINYVISQCTKQH